MVLFYLLSLSCSFFLIDRFFDQWPYKASYCKYQKDTAYRSCEEFQISAMVRVCYSLTEVLLYHRSEDKSK